MPEPRALPARDPAGSGPGPPRRGAGSGAGGGASPAAALGPSHSGSSRPFLFLWAEREPPARGLAELRVPRGCPASPSFLRANRGGGASPARGCLLGGRRLGFRGGRGRRPRRGLREKLQERAERFPQGVSRRSHPPRPHDSARVSGFPGDIGKAKACARQVFLFAEWDYLIINLRMCATGFLKGISRFPPSVYVKCIHNDCCFPLCKSVAWKVYLVYQT